ncbi:hypothetical protein RM704_06960 [Streptomyces sp. DSM 3412]|uniref:Integral membrane protein n=1 Tax=Streptomyces gottesmaniae TaxID=3075518 RepID=A0ABU2YSA4_9ACTN|nr:hypothetical protein [Streptomyces sp. DSM 3412]MDT0567204.1 hypothetical protein [Streptomyces sp. DSM 3412]
MQIDITTVMAALTVVGLASLTVSRGRWASPFWLVVVSFLVAYPFTHTLLDRVADAPDGWFRWLFQLACGSLLSTLLAPVWHGLRRRSVRGPESPGEAPQVDGSRTSS